MNPLFSITSEPIVLSSLRQRFQDPRCGALVLFEGLVRNHHQGKKVKTLSYEHHPIMAEPAGQMIAQEALAKFEVTEVYAVHRVGALAIGELAIVTAAAAAHRAAAFDACQYLIDEIKHRVPIWKYEEYLDGTAIYTEQCEGCSSRSAS